MRNYYLKKSLLSVVFVLFSLIGYSQAVDYSVVSVPEESGNDFRMISSKNDYVCMPEVRRSAKGIDWYTNRILDVSADGWKIAYLAMRGEATNVFVRDLDRQSTSIQRTNRKAVMDFSYSPDGNWILMVGSSPVTYGNSIYWNTDIYVCRTDGSSLSQLTYHVAEDLSPVWSKDGKFIYFISQRGDASGVANIWRMTFNVL